MPVTVEWFNEQKTVLFTRFSPPATLAELAVAQDEALAKMESVDHPVIAVVDFEAMDTIPSNIITRFPKISSHPSARHPNNILTIVITSNRTMEGLLGIFQKVYDKLTVVRDWETVSALLQQDALHEIVHPHE